MVRRKINSIYWAMGVDGREGYEEEEGLGVCGVDSRRGGDCGIEV
jgi:hypothetical protein